MVQARSSRLLRSIEVYEGDRSQQGRQRARLGSSNFVTPSNHTAFAPNILRLDGSSSGTIRGSFQVSCIAGAADILINGTLTNSDGYRDHETQCTRSFNPNIGCRLAPGLETRTYVGSSFVDQKVRGLLTLDQALETPRRASGITITRNRHRKVQTERFPNHASFLLDIDS